MYIVPHNFTSDCTCIFFIMFCALSLLGNQSIAAVAICILLILGVITVVIVLFSIGILHNGSSKQGKPNHI